MPHFKSWSDLQKRLEEMVCPSLQGRIKYFYTRYLEAGGSNGRAAILLDGQEIAAFTCSNGWQQIKEGISHQKDLCSKYDLMDEHAFLDAVLTFRNMDAQDALNSSDDLLRVLAILDRRIGKRTLIRLYKSEAYLAWAEWTRPVAEARFHAEGIL